MIRISDIIRMGDSEEPREEQRPLMKETQKEDIPSITREIEADKVRGAKLYNRGIALIKEVLDKTREGETLDSRPIFEFTKMLIEAMFVEESEQLSRFYESSSSEDYLPHHSVNVGLLSTQIGMWLGLNKSELTELTIAGFLHDLGMVKVEGIVQKKGKLGLMERRRVEEHPRHSEKVLREMKCLNEEGLTAVRTHHEKGQRHRFSQIISLADIYEAITHPRPYKKARPPHQAVGEIIDKEALSFQPDIMRMFVNNIGIYPIGSWVKLSTGEIGVVIGINKGYPLRPRVNIMFNHLGERLKEAKILDFISESYFYIEGPVDIVDNEKLREKWEEESRKEDSMKAEVAGA
jgi:HD-GYP domain-containing protein (c-di-GMP phosphodiesterase class II)